jgi:hypothetical protein
MPDAYASDSQERVDVARILAKLPKGHPAHSAFSAGEPTWKIAHLVQERLDLVVLLSRAVIARYARSQRPAVEHRTES